jgi:hypothetical protein
MASVVLVTTADLLAGSGNAGCWGGAALAVGTAIDADKQAAASGTKRIIVCGEVYRGSTIVREKTTRTTTVRTKLG